jgi:spore coat polysaccharide biosynthesis predicted glycosyltransferase SpsG
LCVTLADNQVDIARALADAGACVYLGPDDESFAPRLESTLKSLLNDPARVRALSERAYALVDGRGAERVCDALGAAA